MNIRIAALVLPVAALLAGCNAEILDVSLPSQINVERVQVAEDTRTETLDVFDINSRAVNIVADQYLRTGRGPMQLTIGYPAHDIWKEKEIRQQGDLYKKAFVEYGVKDISVTYVAMPDSAYTSEAVVSYTALTARPPEGCMQLPGKTGAETLPDIEAYKFGCEIQTSMTRMVADPADLLGRGGTPNDNSRRHGAVVEQYLSGTPNEPMDGITASDVAAESAQ